MADPADIEAKRSLAKSQFETSFKRRVSSQAKQTRKAERTKNKKKLADKLKTETEELVSVHVDKNYGGAGDDDLTLSAVAGTWRAILDDASGEHYYSNTSTGETTWTKPASFDVLHAGATPSPVEEATEDDDDDDSAATSEDDQFDGGGGGGLGGGMGRPGYGRPPPAMSSMSNMSSNPSFCGNAGEQRAAGQGVEDYGCALQDDCELPYEAFFAAGIKCKKLGQQQTKVFMKAHKDYRYLKNWVVVPRGDSRIFFYDTLEDATIQVFHRYLPFSRIENIMHGKIYRRIEFLYRESQNKHEKAHGTSLLCATDAEAERVLESFRSRWLALKAASSNWTLPLGMAKPGDNELDARQGSDLSQGVFDQSFNQMMGGGQEGVGSPSMVEFDDEDVKWTRALDELRVDAGQQNNEFADEMPAAQRAAEEAAVRKQVDLTLAWPECDLADPGADNSLREAMAKQALLRARKAGMGFDSEPVQKMLNIAGAQGCGDGRPGGGGGGGGSAGNKFASAARRSEVAAATSALSKLKQQRQRVSKLMVQQGDQFRKKIQLQQQQKKKPQASPKGKKHQLASLESLQSDEL
jgi:hypothetical protein